MPYFETGHFSEWRDDTSSNTWSYQYTAIIEVESCTSRISMLVLEQNLLVLETVRELMLVLEQILIVLELVLEVEKFCSSNCSSWKNSARAIFIFLTRIVK